MAILGLMAGMICAASAQDYHGGTAGDYFYWYGPNGYFGSGQRVGSFIYYHDNYGSGSGQDLGSYRYFNYVPDPFLDENGE